MPDETIVCKRSRKLFCCVFAAYNGEMYGIHLHRLERAGRGRLRRPWGPCEGADQGRRSLDEDFLL